MDGFQRDTVPRKECYQFTQKLPTFDAIRNSALSRSIFASPLQQPKAHTPTQPFEPTTTQNNVDEFDSSPTNYRSAYPMKSDEIMQQTTFHHFLEENSFEEG